MANQQITTVAIKEASFYAYHGYYEEERIIGNVFVVNIDVSFKSTAHNDCMTNTINYVQLYQIATEVMATPAQLLEYVAQQILDKVLALSTKIVAAKVTVAKKMPPLKFIYNIVHTSVALSYEA